MRGGGKGESIYFMNELSNKERGEEERGEEWEKKKRRKKITK
jgi:hypothetical protein